jgi:hypothetical protein
MSCGLGRRRRRCWEARPFLDDQFLGLFLNDVIAGYLVFFFEAGQLVVFVVIHSEVHGSSHCDAPVRRRSAASVYPVRFLNELCSLCQDRKWLYSRDLQADDPKTGGMTDVKDILVSIWKIRSYAEKSHSLPGRNDGEKVAHLKGS